MRTYNIRKGLTQLSQHLYAYAKTTVLIGNAYGEWSIRTLKDDIKDWTRYSIQRASLQATDGKRWRADVNDWVRLRPSDGLPL